MKWFNTRLYTKQDKNPFRNLHLSIITVHFYYHSNACRWYTPFLVWRITEGGLLFML